MIGCYCTCVSVLLLVKRKAKGCEETNGGKHHTSIHFLNFLKYAPAKSGKIRRARAVRSYLLGNFSNNTSYTVLTNLLSNSSSFITAFPVVSGTTTRNSSITKESVGADASPSSSIPIVAVIVPPALGGEIADGVRLTTA